MHRSASRLVRPLIGLAALVGIFSGNTAAARDERAPSPAAASTAAKDFGAELAAVARRQSHTSFSTTPPTARSPIPWGTCPPTSASAPMSSCGHTGRTASTCKSWCTNRGPAPGIRTSTIAGSKCCAASSPAPAPPAHHRQCGRLQARRPRHLPPAERLFLQDPHRHRRRRENPASVPFVNHNRGWGVQAEDWLFAEKITGHYRYGGPGQRRARSFLIEAKRFDHGTVAPTLVARGGAWTRLCIKRHTIRLQHAH